MLLTLFSDASYCPNTHAAGWGAWVRKDGWVSGKTMGGELSGVKSASEAEMFAISQTVETLSKRGDLEGVEAIIIQSDCVRALGLLAVVGHANIKNHSAGAEITKGHKNPTKTESAGISTVTNLAKLYGISLWVKHVRGHKEGDKRQWVNRECDRIAGDYMRLARASVNLANRYDK